MTELTQFGFLRSCADPCGKAVGLLVLQPPACLPNFAPQVFKASPIKIDGPPLKRADRRRQSRSRLAAPEARCVRCLRDPVRYSAQLLWLGVQLLFPKPSQSDAQLLRRWRGWLFGLELLGHIPLTLVERLSPLLRLCLWLNLANVLLIYVQIVTIDVSLPPEARVFMPRISFPSLQAPSKGGGFAGLSSDKASELPVLPYGYLLDPCLSGLAPAALPWLPASCTGPNLTALQRLGYVVPFRIFGVALSVRTILTVLLGLKLWDPDLKKSLRGARSTVSAELARHLKSVAVDWTVIKQPHSFIRPLLPAMLATGYGNHSTVFDLQSSTQLDYVQRYLYTYFFETLLVCDVPSSTVCFVLQLS